MYFLLINHDTFYQSTKNLLLSYRPMRRIEFFVYFICKELITKSINYKNILLVFFFYFTSYLYFLKDELCTPHLRGVRNLQVFKCWIVPLCSEQISRIDFCN